MRFAFAPCLCLVLLTSCGWDSGPTSADINTYLEGHWWGVKQRGPGQRTFCAHRVRGRDRGHIYIWQYCANWFFLQNHLVSDAGSSGNMKLTLDGRGQIVKAEDRLDSQEEWQIMPAWVRYRPWIPYGKSYNDVQHELEDEMAARMFRGPDSP